MLSSCYARATDKLRYICTKHIDKGEQQISYDKFRNGQGCYFCGRERINEANRNKRHSFEFIKQQFVNRDMELLSETYINANSLLMFVCLKHRSKGIQKISFSKLKNIAMCKYCVWDSFSTKFKYSLEYVKSVFEGKGLRLVSTEYNGNHEKLEYICNRHPELGTQRTSLTTLHAGGIGCKKCCITIITNKQRWSDDVFKQKVANVHNNTVLSIDTYYGSDKKTKFKCSVCSFIWIATPNSVVSQGTGCPQCKLSHGEKRIRKYLHERKLCFEQQKEFDGLTGVGGGRLSYDFYLPKYAVLIEYQGQFHDGTASYQTKEQFTNQQKHDELKKLYAEKHRYRLQEIWYYEFGVIEKILNALLNEES